MSVRLETSEAECLNDILSMCSVEWSCLHVSVFTA